MSTLAVVKALVQWILLNKKNERNLGVLSKGEKFASLSNGEVMSFTCQRNYDLNFLDKKIAQSKITYLDRNCHIQYHYFI